VLVTLTQRFYNVELYDDYERTGKYEEENIHGYFQVLSGGTE